MQKSIPDLVTTIHALCLPRVEYAEQAIYVGGFLCTLFLVTDVQSLAGRHVCNGTLYRLTSGSNGTVMIVRQTGLPGFTIRGDKRTGHRGDLSRDLEVYLPCRREET